MRVAGLFRANHLGVGGPGRALAARLPGLLRWNQGGHQQLLEDTFSLRTLWRATSLKLNGVGRPYPPECPGSKDAKQQHFSQKQGQERKPVFRERPQQKGHTKITGHQ